ncbi:hypothetical protein LTR36_008688 [Oleoguttula mirabilis]|uniref:Uncharacterized protein n=1 Tax=Oleoguttula mirabilis TaxID=1507867 RepID=A0AAV9JTP0_9PEZI|nr:hypothetical protein LTR36_008688 [Oleoguttula mirabilis]
MGKLKSKLLSCFSDQASTTADDSPAPPQTAQPSQPQPGPEPQAFRRVPEGCGGTYRFDQSTTPFIGVDGCRSCLGVYFAIDHDRCFAAHIWPWVEPTKNKPGGLRISDPTGFAKMRSEIVRRLDEESERSDWPPKSQLMRDSLVMVCKQQAPEASSVAEWDTTVGLCAALGVNDWLGHPADRSVKARLQGGFVVRHPGRIEEYCELFADPDRWRAEGEADDGRWRFGV